MLRSASALRRLGRTVQRVSSGLPSLVDRHRTRAQVQLRNEVAGVPPQRGGHGRREGGPRPSSLRPMSAPRASFSSPVPTTLRRLVSPESTSTAASKPRCTINCSRIALPAARASGEASAASSSARSEARTRARRLLRPAPMRSGFRRLRSGLGPARRGGGRGHDRHCAADRRDAGRANGPRGAGRGHDRHCRGRSSRRGLGGRSLRRSRVAVAAGGGGGRSLSGGAAPPSAVAARR